MEDPWIQETVTMKLPIEETEGRQQYQRVRTPEEKKEKDRREDQRKGKEEFAIQFGEAEPIEWMVYVYPEGRRLLEEGNHADSNQSTHDTHGRRLGLAPLLQYCYGPKPVSQFCLWQGISQDAARGTKLQFY